MFHLASLLGLKPRTPAKSPRSKKDQQRSIQAAEAKRQRRRERNLRIKEKQDEKLSKL